MITSRTNRRLKHIRRLTRSKANAAVLDTPHLVREAIASGLRFEDVLFTPEFLASEAGSRLSRELPLEPELVEPSLLKQLSDVGTPQGVVAVAELARSALAEEEVLGDGLWIYVEGLQDPGNLGALARSAEAAGASGLLLSPHTVHPNHPRALRASAGSLIRLRAHIKIELVQLETALPSHDRIALVPRGGERLFGARLPTNGLLLLGAERGLSLEAEAQVDRRLTVPMLGSVESLNATVAASLVLFEWARRISS